MYIKIVTTEKKITKNLVNQMKYAGRAELRDGECLGYMRNTVKGARDAMLIEHVSEYYVCPMGFQKSLNHVYRKALKGHGVFEVQFDTPGACNAWWEAYQKALTSEGAKLQIYI